MKITVVTTLDEQVDLVSKLSLVISDYKLLLEVDWIAVDKINNKTLRRLALDVSNPFLIAGINKKSNIECSLCTIMYDEKNKPVITKVSPEWHKLQKRIVNAGRKSELLLQACKLTSNSRVIDATAGFGHDSLILASTLLSVKAVSKPDNEPEYQLDNQSNSPPNSGRVTMLEQNPVMVLLLILEQQGMMSEKNWQGLMSRLTIQFANSTDYLDSLKKISNDHLADVVYLDPMFPQDSYQGAKVGKGMQVLHGLVQPPTIDEEFSLLSHAKTAVGAGGRVVVKRPKIAPFLANVKPDESWSNDVVRFDGYFM